MPMIGGPGIPTYNWDLPGQYTGGEDGGHNISPVLGSSVSITAIRLGTHLCRERGAMGDSTTPAVTAYTSGATFIQSTWPPPTQNPGGAMGDSTIYI